MTKKILYLITQAEWGGAQKYIYDLANNLANEFEVLVAVGEKKQKAVWLDTLVSRGIKVWRLKHVMRELNFWHDFFSGFELLELFFKTQPDIIHLNSSKIGSTGAAMAWLYKKISGRQVKIIYTAHGFVFNEPLSYWRRRFYCWSEKISGYFKDKIICVSEQDKITGLNDHIAFHKKFITIHNGIDFDKINFLDKKSARQRLATAKNIPLDSLWIGNVANFYPSKGIDYLIRTARILVDKYPRLTFIVIGEGDLQEELEVEIEKFHLKNNFFFPGAFRRASEYLKAFDIFCLSSVKEGFPYTILEALAAGLPIVATSVGGVLEIIEPEINGLVVPPQKPKELAAALEKIISDPALIGNFRQANLEKVKKFSLTEMVRKTKAIYNES